VALERLSKALEAAPAARPSRSSRGGNPDLGRAAAFNVSPAVAVDNDASDAATVVEVSGRDRPGLLEALTRTLADAGVSIQSAMSTTTASAPSTLLRHRADGAETDRRQAVVALKIALGAVLQDADNEPSRPRLKLERARASVAR